MIEVKISDVLSRYQEQKNNKLYSYGHHHLLEILNRFVKIVIDGRAHEYSTNEKCVYALHSIGEAYRRGGLSDVEDLSAHVLVDIGLTDMNIASSGIIGNYGKIKCARLIKTLEEFDVIKDIYTKYSKDEIRRYSNLIKKNRILIGDLSEQIYSYKQRILIIKNKNNEYRKLLKTKKVILWSKLK